MKLKQEHQEQLQSMIEKKLDSLEGPLSDYYPKYMKYGVLNESKFRWALLYSCVGPELSNWFREVYVYANDNNIHTALKKVLKEHMKDA